MDLVGSSAGLALMQRAVIAASQRNKESGVATATIVKGCTVVTPRKVNEKTGSDGEGAFADGSPRTER